MIPRKKKTCKECGEERYLFGHGLCQPCYRRTRARSVSSKGKVPLKGRKSSHSAQIRPRKQHKTVTDEWLQAHWGFKSQVELFDHIWEARKPVCEITGQSLKWCQWNKALKYSCCAHVLPKGLYPLYKLNEENVLLIHPELHHVIDQGTEKVRAKYAPWVFLLWDTMYDALKEEYETFKKEYLL